MLTPAAPAEMTGGPAEGGRAPYSKPCGRLQAGEAGRIGVVYPGSPASEAGLQTGDTVSRIDDQTTVALDTRGLWRKLEGPVGVLLRLDTGTPARHITLTVRDLL
jgi:C-terminal processing protease CtpA/Prc